VPRTYRVDVTRTAERDLAAIHAVIARDNPAAAAAWPDTIERNIVSLGRWPRRCPVIPEAAEFRVAGSRAIILRVIHGAQLLDLDILE
jgi:plasmid stabilization system protein ParE